MNTMNTKLILENEIKSIKNNQSDMKINSPKIKKIDHTTIVNQLNNQSRDPSPKTMKRNISSENFMKFQWAWTL